MPNKLIFKILLTITSVWGLDLNAQEYNKERYTVELSVTPLATVHIGPFQSLTGGASQKSNNYISGVIRGIYRHTAKWSFSAGLGYSSQEVTTSAAIVNPSIEQSKYSSNLHIWELPIEARFNFLKHFYANAGPLVHAQLNSNNHVDKQTGLGINIGLGVKVPLSPSFNISLSPHYKMYSLIPFQTESHHDRTQLLGIAIGASYIFGKH